MRTLFLHVYVCCAHRLLSSLLCMRTHMYIYIQFMFHHVCACLALHQHIALMLHTILRFTSFLCSRNVLVCIRAYVLARHNHACRCAYVSCMLGIICYMYTCAPISMQQYMYICMYLYVLLSMPLCYLMHGTYVH